MSDRRNGASSASAMPVPVSTWFTRKNVNPPSSTGTRVRTETEPWPKRRPSVVMCNIAPAARIESVYWEMLNNRFQ